MKYIFLAFRFFLSVLQRIGYIISLKKFPPPFAASVAVILQGNRILLLNRSDGLGLSLPGGFIDLYENAEKAVIREVFEETGINVTVKQIFCILSGKRKNTSIGSVDIVYLCEPMSFELNNSIEGKAGWYEIFKLQEKDLALDYYSIIEKVKKDFFL